MYYDGFDYMPRWDNGKPESEPLHVVGVYDNMEDAKHKLEKLSFSPVPKDEIVIIDPQDFRHDELAGISAEIEDSSEGAVAGVRWGAIIGVSIGFLTRAVLPAESSQNAVLDMLISVFLGGTLGALVGLAIGAISSGVVSKTHSHKYDEALAEGKFLMAVKHQEWEKPVRRWLSN
jgi:hypothetical protein